MPQFNPIDESKFNVCIIGGGPSGLCSLRHLLASSDAGSIQPVLFEQQNDIGGVWNYSGPEVTMWDSNGNPMVLPMYSDLRCNLPKQLMEFHDFKHKKSDSTFVTQQELHEYLVDYADRFQLWPYINLLTRIVNIRPFDGGKWTVTTENSKSYHRSTFTFDAVVCCVGVNFYPKIPSIVGMNKFLGDILHSKYFKTVDEFKDKKIVLLGLGPSAADLCLKLQPVAKQVVVCHRSPGGFGLGLLPPTVRETSSIKRLNKWSVVTESDEEIPCDVLILCTGYKARFPFLDFSDLLSSNLNDAENDDIDDEGHSSSSIADHLYKRMFFPKVPSFCFINAHGLVSEFLVMEVQAKYFVSWLQCKFQLPLVSQMEKQAKLEHKLMAKQGKLTEAMRLGDPSAFSEVEKYLQDLAIEGGFSKEFLHIPLHLTVWQWVIRRIFGSLAVYRHDQIQILSPTCWEYACAKKTESKLEQNKIVKIFQLCEDGGVVTQNRFI